MPKNDDDFYLTIVSQTDKNNYLEKLICDEKYNSYISKLTRDQLKSANFFEDLPNLEIRNAFKIDKKGDKNNICFDTLHFKNLCKYNVPYFKDASLDILLKPSAKSNQNKTKLSKRQLRKKQLLEAQEKRYYSKLTKSQHFLTNEKTEIKQKVDTKKEDLSQSALSNKMWLYLEMKNELEKEYELNESNKVDKTSDFIKYLDEHKNDIIKWLEFIDYQTNLFNQQKFHAETQQHNENNMKEELKNQSLTVIFDKKIAIFDKAITENPRNFRLKMEKLKYKSSSFEIISSYNALETIENEFIELLIDQSTNIRPKLMSQNTQFELLANLFEIWFEYLKFLIHTNSSNITFNKIKRTFQKCFNYFLPKESNELVRLNSNSELFFNAILKLVDNYCSYLCKNGYVEKVIGIYQALMEFNLNSFSNNPNSNYANMDSQSKKSLFELYWDMGLPKFGEKYSIGWINCLENRENIFEKLENDSISNRYDDQLDLIETNILNCNDIRIEYRWYEIERLRSLINWYPFYPQIVIGESADDCADQDRLISFEDDINFLLFDLNNLKTISNKNDEIQLNIDCFKFKLFCKFLKTLNLISMNDECLNINESPDYFYSFLNSSKMIEDEDIEFTRYLNEKIDYLNDAKSIDREDISFCGNFNFLQRLFNNLNDSYTQNNFRMYSKESLNEIKTLLKNVILNTVEFIRNCFNQSKNGFQTLKYKTNVTILKWKFELFLINLLKKYGENIKDEEFDHKKLRQNLLDESKQTLSLEENRQNFDLWKQYGILKWLLNYQNDFKITNLKDSRKVFDNLLNIMNNNIDVYSLCCDYIKLELGIYYEQFDVNTSSVKSLNQATISTINFQNGFFDLKQDNLVKSSMKDLMNLKNNQIELLVDNCLNRVQNQTKLKQKVTFKIGMSGSTKLLLAKRDFQIEYENLLNECKTNKHNSDLINKFFHFHQVYSLFLLCTNDLDKLIEINDKLLLKETVLNLYQSMTIEFYLNILNYLFYQETRLTKFMYKTKLFTIIRATLATKNNFQSYLRLLQLTLLRFKLRNSSLFCSELLENNDIDLMFEKIANKLVLSSSPTFQQFLSSNFQLSLIYSHLNKLDKIIEKTEQDSDSSMIALSLFNKDIQQHGHHHKIRRLFERALKQNPKSLQLWIFYFKFEYIFLEQNKVYLNKNQLNSFQNKILYIYYQSIRNLPYFKILYMNGVKCIPEKYIEIMSLLSNREIRVYFPIQELNMLLEPIKRPGELLDIEENEDFTGEEKESSVYSRSVSISSVTEEKSQSEQESDDDEELIDLDEKINDSSSISSNLSVSNCDLKDL
jgi:hypothetical protein